MPDEMRPHRQVRPAVWVDLWCTDPDRKTRHRADHQARAAGHEVTSSFRPLSSDNAFVAKASKKMEKKTKPRDPERAARLRYAMAHTLLAVAFCGLLSAGFLVVKRYVERDVVFPGAPPTVKLVDRPVWMSDFLAAQIERAARPIGTHSAFDHQMLVDVADTLSHNPWVKQVHQVRRAYGQAPGDTLEVDCEWRAPVALVKWGDFYWLIDGDGVKLPEQFTAKQVPAIVLGRDNKTNIRIIEGVNTPPVESGQHWPGDDLAAGIDMVKLLYAKPYAEEIGKVDVTNFNGRKQTREAQIVLVTKYGTQVKWGRPVNAKDFFVEVPPSRKLDYIQSVFKQFGRVDGNRPWIDIRFDKITYPSPDSLAKPQTATARGA